MKPTRDYIENAIYIGSIPKFVYHYGEANKVSGM